MTRPPMGPKKCGPGAICQPGRSLLGLMQRSFWHPHAGWRRVSLLAGLALSISSLAYWHEDISQRAEVSVLREPTEAERAERRRAADAEFRAAQPVPDPRIDRILAATKEETGKEISLSDTLRLTHARDRDSVDYERFLREQPSLARWLKTSDEGAPIFSHDAFLWHQYIATLLLLSAASFLCGMLAVTLSVESAVWIRAGFRSER